MPTPSTSPSLESLYRPLWLTYGLAPLLAGLVLQPAHRLAEVPEPVDRAPAAALLREAVEILPDPLRAVFCLREIELLSTEQTAEALGLTVENVRVPLHRAKRSLRQTLDERIGREVRRLYLFDGARCDRMVERVFAALDTMSR